MPLKHPKYPNYYIYFEALKEKPVAGAFYMQDGETLYPFKDLAHSLFWYGKYGCGAGSAWRYINQNLWNRQNLVYRSTSTNCKSPTVNSEIAMSTTNPGGKGAFIALCQNDVSEYDKKLGAKYPILWIPPNCGSPTSINIVPEGIIPKEEPKTKPTWVVKGPSVLPKVINIPYYNPTVVSVTKPKFITPTIPGTSGEVEKGPFGPGVVPTEADPTKPDYPGPSYPPTYPPDTDGGCPWWGWLLLAVAGVGVGAVAYKKSKQGKKKRKK